MRHLCLTDLARMSWELHGSDKLNRAMAGIHAQRVGMLAAVGTVADAEPGHRA
jgi:hypothetical protein